MFYAHRSDRFKFIMCTNGRCGSTLLKRWYLSIHGMDQPIPGDHPSVHRALPYNDEKLYVEKERFNEYPHFKFLVVRNPWERLVSFYKVWVVANQQNHEGLGRDCTFEQLVDQLLENGPSDSHTWHQAYGLNGLKFDKLVYLEHLARDMRSVCNSCGIDFDEQFFAQRVFEAPVVGGGKIKSPHKVPGHKFYEVDEWPSWQNFYTQELADKVSKIYKLDCTYFGYRWDSISDPVVISTMQSESKPSKDKRSSKSRRRP